MTGTSNNLRGAFFMMASMAAFTFNDVSMKALSDELPLFQAIFLRGSVTCLMMYLVALALGGLRFVLPRREWGLIALRTFSELAATYLFLSALFNMPLANATAILQALPLAVTLAGAVFLGEAIGWRRLIAIIVGLVGVLMIVQPGADGFNIYSVYVLGAVGFVTVRDLASRRLSHDTPSMTPAITGAFAVTLGAGLASTTETWVQPSGLAWAQLAAASVFIIGGYLFSIMAMRIGDIGTVTPFRYTSLLWALLLGFVVFGDWPDGLTLIGAAIVVGTGIFTWIRERKLEYTPTPSSARN